MDGMTIPGSPESQDAEEGVQSWGELLSQSVESHHVASGPATITEGILEVPLEGQSPKETMSQPVTLISGAVLVGTRGSTEHVDLFAFVAANKKERRSRPTYMGTFSREQGKATERTLLNNGVSVSRLASAKLRD